MFYSKLILAKKGTYGHIWLAAHSSFQMHQKLSKKEIFDTDIREAADAVQNPATPFALRMSGHLLLGVVRIFSHKVEFLYNDSNEAFSKMKKQAAKRKSTQNLVAVVLESTNISISTPNWEDPDFYMKALEEDDLQIWGAMDTHSTSLPHQITLNERQFEPFTIEDEPTTFSTPFPGAHPTSPQDATPPEDQVEPGAPGQEPPSSPTDQESDEHVGHKRRNPFSLSSSPVEKKRKDPVDERKSLMSVASMPEPPNSPISTGELEPVTPFMVDDHNTTGFSNMPSFAEPSPGGLGTPGTAPKSRKRKTESRRDEKTELNAAQLRSFRQNSSQTLRGNQPPDKRRAIEQNRRAIKCIFERSRMKTFGPAVHDLFSQILMGQNKRSKWADPEQIIPSPGIPRQLPPSTPNASFDEPPEPVEETPHTQLSPMEADLEEQNWSTLGPATGEPASPALLTKLAGEKDAHEEMVMEEINDKLEDADATTFKAVIGSSRNRVGAAIAFFQILSLSSKGRIGVSQSTGYGEITIRRGDTE